MSIRLSLLCMVLLMTGVFPAFAVKTRVVVSAYHKHSRTATGTLPHYGTCAAPRRWLGWYVKIPGKGAFKVTDVCRSGVDIWLPSTAACRRWGRRVMTVRIERPRTPAIRRQTAGRRR